MSTTGKAESYIELKGSLSLPDAITGKSAYEIAVANGYKGTEAEWLESLRCSIVTPEMYGAKGDGVTDDTAAFQQALDSGKPIVANARYFIERTLVVGEGNDVWICGGTFIINSKDTEQYPLLEVTNAKSLNISNVSFITTRDNKNIYPPSGHTRASGTLSSNVVFIKASGIGNVVVTDVDFENSEYDINLYNCKTVYINRFKSTNASMCSYMEGNETVRIENGSIRLYDLLGGGDHPFYICFGNDDVIVKDTKIYSTANNGVMPLHAYASDEQNATYGMTKRVMFDGCYVEYSDLACSCVVEESFIVKNTVLNCISSGDIDLIYATHPNVKLLFENVTIGGLSNIRFSNTLGSVIVEFRSCAFNNLLYSTNCSPTATFNFYDCKMENGVQFQDSSLAKFNFYRSKITKENGFALYTMQPSDNVKMYSCELYSNGDGILSARNNSCVVTMIGCFGDNKHPSEKYLEYNSSFKPLIKCYNCVFPTLGIRSGDENVVVGSNNVFANG